MDTTANDALRSLTKKKMRMMKTSEKPEVRPQTACEILCEWAWTKVNLENLQRDHQGKPPGEGANLIADAIRAFKHALRKKKKLDSENGAIHAALDKM